MKRSEELKIKRKEKLQRMQSIVDGAKKEEKARNLTKDEQTEYDNLKSEIESLDKEIENAEYIEKRSAEPSKEGNAEEPKDEGPEGAQYQKRNQPNKAPHQRKETKPYRVGKAIREFSNGGPVGLTGLEKEQHDEMARNIQSNGLLVPFQPMKRDANTTSHDSSIDVRIDPDLSIIGKEPLYSKMGLTVLPGLQGQIKLGKKTADEAEKVAEKSEITQTSNVPSHITLSPERYGITDIFTKELLSQENPAVQAAIVNDMVKGCDRKITSEAYAVALAAASEVASGALTVAGFNALMAEVDIDGAFAMDRGSFFEAKAVKVDAGSGRFLVTPGTDNGVGRSHDGAPVFYSNLFKDGDAQQYVLYGAWEEVYLGFWGALEILMNPYTYQNKGQIEMTVNRLADLACRNSAAFVKSPDLDPAT